MTSQDIKAYATAFKGADREAAREIYNTIIEKCNALTVYKNESFLLTDGTRLMIASGLNSADTAAFRKLTRGSGIDEARTMTIKDMDGNVLSKVVFKR